VPADVQRPRRRIDAGDVVVDQEVMETERRDRPVERLERHPAVAGSELELVDADAVVACASAAACLPYVHIRNLRGLSG
jgi:hypothetical protein